MAHFAFTFTTLIRVLNAATRVVTGTWKFDRGLQRFRGSWR